MNREIYHSNQYDLNPPEPEPGMTPEEANFCLGLVTNLYNETPESADKIRELTLCLMQTPESFWVRFFELANPDPSLRERCDAFVKSGAYLPSAAREQMMKIAQVIL